MISDIVDGSDLEVGAYLDGWRVERFEWLNPDRIRIAFRRNKSRGHQMILFDTPPRISIEAARQRLKGMADLETYGARFV